MAVAENYIPQADNVDNLEKAVSDLVQQSATNTEKKNSIMNKLDSLVAIINGSNPDYSRIIEEIDYFMLRYGSTLDSGAANDQNLSQFDKLKLQNFKLKEIYCNQISHNEQLMELNDDYEANISRILSTISDQKYSTELKLNQSVLANFHSILQLKSVEFELFMKLLSNDEKITQFSKILSDLYSFILSSDSKNQTNLSELDHYFKNLSILSKNK